MKNCVTAFHKWIEKSLEAVKYDIILKNIVKTLTHFEETSKEPVLR